MSQDITVDPPFHLSSGRVLEFTRMPNGAQNAVPTTGSAAMTGAEWHEYCAAMYTRSLERGTTFIVG